MGVYSVEGRGIVLSRIAVFDWDYDDPLARVTYKNPYNNNKLTAEPKTAFNALRSYAARGAMRPSLGVFYAEYTDHLKKIVTDAGGDATRKRFPKEITVRGWSMDFRWVARMARFDDIQVEEQLRVFKDRAQKNHETRIDMLEVYRERIVLALNVIDPATAQWADVTAALKMVVQELRREYSAGTETTKRGRGRPPVGENTLMDIFAHLSDEEVEDAIANLEAAGVPIEE